MRSQFKRKSKNGTFSKCSRILKMIAVMIQAIRAPANPRTSPAMEKPYWGTFEDGERRASVCVRIGENDYFDHSRPESAARLGDTFNSVQYLRSLSPAKPNPQANALAAVQWPEGKE